MTARQLAVAALVRQEQDGFSNLVLDAEMKKHPLEGRDRAFAGAIFYTVLEHRETLDYILNRFLPKGLAKLDAPVREILRSGLAQPRYMQVPVSAAVNEAVKLTRAFKKSSASGLVNAVLRRACAFEPDAEAFSSELERLCVLGSVSRPVAEFFLKHYPDEAMELLTRPADGACTALRVNTLKITPQALTKRLLAENAKSVRPGLAEIPGALLAEFEGSPADNDSFRAGLFHVEGQASQLAALAVGAKPGETVLDLCAAPGGKSLALAEQMGDKGRLFSCDVTENRVSLLQKAVQRMGLSCVTVLCSDAAVPNPAFPPADRILTDVPCSGLGILAKKPDIRYKKLEELEALVALQAKILDTAADALRPGGRLVYSTCTLNPDENENQIRAFLMRRPDFRVALSEGFFPAGMTLSPFGALSVPTRTGMDGFFICALEKAGADGE